MKERYELLRQAGSCPNIKTYNQKFLDKKLRPDKGHRFLPYIVAVIDEYAQLTLVTSGKPEARNVSRSITSSIISLAQMGMGFARSARVMSQLEAAGIVGPQDARSKNREVLVKNFTELDEILKKYLK